jgi:hypothetical protein
MNQFCSAGQVRQLFPKEPNFSGADLPHDHNNQLCSPISGRAWWVLAAVEQATMYFNSLFTAIGFAAGQAKGK